MPDDPKPIEKRFFLCTGQIVKYQDLYKYPYSHIVGEVCHLKEAGKEVIALARWEVSVSCTVVPPIKPLVDCYMVGDNRRFKCKFPEGCDNKQDWEMGKAAFLALMQRYRLEAIPLRDV